MPDYNLRKGVIYGSSAILLIGLQPVIANSRPQSIDPIIFAAVAALIEALIFLPIYLIERKKIKMDNKIPSLLNGWKKKRNILILAIIGLTFSFVPIMLFIGFELTGAINSALALRSEIVVALFFGYLLLKEKISYIQLFFCVTLLFGLFLAITEGFRYIVEFDLGVLILVISVILFTFVHTITKTSLNRDELFPSQVVFVRNLMSGSLVFLIYILIFPLGQLTIIFDGINFLYFLLMGIDYGFSLFLWYKTLSYIEIGKSSILISFTPIVSSFFSSLFLGEVFTTFHLIGTIIIIVSIIMIVKMKKVN